MCFIKYSAAPANNNNNNKNSNQFNELDDFFGVSPSAPAQSIVR